MMSVTGILRGIKKTSSYQVFWVIKVRVVAIQLYILYI